MHNSHAHYFCCCYWSPSLFVVFLEQYSHEIHVGDIKCSEYNSKWLLLQQDLLRIQDRVWRASGGQMVLVTTSQESMIMSCVLRIGTASEKTAFDVTAYSMGAMTPWKQMAFLVAFDADNSIATTAWEVLFKIPLYITPWTHYTRSYSETFCFPWCWYLWDRWGLFQAFTNNWRLKYLRKCRGGWIPWKKYESSSS